jgi:ribokinase
MGSATVDVFVETEKQTSAVQEVDGKQVPFITYRSGEKVIVHRLLFEVGGGGTNSAAVFAKLGLTTAYLGNIGTDSNGDAVLKSLAEHNIDFIGKRTDALTNYSIILESSLLKDRTILVYKGASEELVLDHVPNCDGKLLYVASLAGQSFHTALQVMQTKRECGSRIAFNPSNYQIEHNRDDVLAMLRLAHIATMNREEAVLLVGDGSNAYLCEKIRALGPQFVAVTMGGKGVVVSNGTRTLRAEPTPNRTVRETTGAGDCFAATFVAALTLGKDVESATRWALVNVENHIAHVGAKAGILSREELERAATADTRPFTDEQ